MPTFTCRVCGTTTTGLVWPDHRSYPPFPWHFVRAENGDILATTCACTPRPQGEGTAQAPAAGPPAKVDQ